MPVYALECSGIFLSSHLLFHPLLNFIQWRGKDIQKGRGTIKTKPRVPCRGQCCLRGCTAVHCLPQEPCAGSGDYKLRCSRAHLLHFCQTWFIALNYVGCGLGQGKACASLAGKWSILCCFCLREFHCPKKWPTLWLFCIQAMLPQCVHTEKK